MRRFKLPVSAQLNWHFRRLCEFVIGAQRIVVKVWGANEGVKEAFSNYQFRDFSIHCVNEAAAINGVYCANRQFLPNVCILDWWNRCDASKIRPNLGPIHSISEPIKRQKQMLIIRWENMKRMEETWLGYDSLTTRAGLDDLRLIWPQHRSNQKVEWHARKTCVLSVKLETECHEIKVLCINSMYLAIRIRH